MTEDLLYQPPNRLWSGPLRWNDTRRKEKPSCPQPQPQTSESLDSPSWDPTWLAIWPVVRAIPSPCSIGHPSALARSWRSIPKLGLWPRKPTTLLLPRSQSRAPRSSWCRPGRAPTRGSVNSCRGSNRATSSWMAATRTSTTRSPPKRPCERRAFTSSARASPAVRGAHCPAHPSCPAAPPSRIRRSALSSRQSQRLPRMSGVSLPPAPTVPATSGRWCTTASNTPICSSSPRRTISSAREPGRVPPKSPIYSQNGIRLSLRVTSLRSPRRYCAKRMPRQACHWLMPSSTRPELKAPAPGPCRTHSTWVCPCPASRRPSSPAASPPAPISALQLRACPARERPSTLMTPMPSLRTSDARSTRPRSSPTRKGSTRSLRVPPSTSGTLRRVISRKSGGVDASPARSSSTALPRRTLPPLTWSCSLSPRISARQSPEPKQAGAESLGLPQPPESPPPRSPLRWPTTTAFVPPVYPLPSCRDSETFSVLTPTGGLISRARSTLSGRVIAQRSQQHRPRTNTRCRAQYSGGVRLWDGRGTTVKRLRLRGPVEHARDRAILKNLVDGSCQQRRNRQNRQSLPPFPLRNRKRVGHDNFVNELRLQDLNRRVGENRVSGRDNTAHRPLLF